MSTPSLTQPAPDTPRTTRAATAALALLLLVVGVYLLHAGRGTAPFFDEWDWITRRRGLSADTLLAPHNGHLSVVPVLLYKTLLQTAGLDHYWVFRTVLALLHLGCAVLVFVLARGRVGAQGALFAAGFVAVLGSAGDDLLWAFQIGFVVAVLFGLAALVALDRDTRRGDVAAAICLALALGSASVGAAFAVAVLVELALHPRRRERWWVFVAPLALYALWYLGYGESELKRENLGATPVYAAESGSAAAGGILGLTLEYGRVLLVGLTAVVATRLWRAERLIPRLVALAAAPAALWVLTALSRAQFKEPTAPRYIYCGAILLVLLVCELQRGYVVPRRQATALLAVLLGFAAVSNAATIDATGGGLRMQARDVEARLGALELAGPELVAPGLQISPTNAPQIQAGPALYAERSFGRLGLTEAELVRAPQNQGLAADNVLERAGVISAVPATGPATQPTGPPPASTGVTGGTLRRRGGCLLTRATGPDARLDVELPDGQALVISASAPAGVLARRFAKVAPTAPIGEVPAGGSIGIVARADRADVPWQLQVASAGNLTVCRAGR
jgi:hypothetical protein